MGIETLFWLMKSFLLASHSSPNQSFRTLHALRACEYRIAATLLINVMLAYMLTIQTHLCVRLRLQEHTNSYLQGIDNLTHDQFTSLLFLVLPWKKRRAHCTNEYAQTQNTHPINTQSLFKQDQYLLYGSVGIETVGLRSISMNVHRLRGIIGICAHACL